jgi:hypothetical protein
MWIFHIFLSLEIKLLLSIIIKLQSANKDDTICTSPKHAKMFTQDELDRHFFVDDDVDDEGDDDMTTMISQSSQIIS